MAATAKYSDLPPFGMVLRAWRLRFSWAPSRNCFIRVQDRPGDRWFVEIVPPQLKLLTKGPGEFRVIEMGQADRLFELSPTMKMIRNVKRPIGMLIDDAGRLVAAP